MHYAMHRAYCIGHPEISFNTRTIVSFVILDPMQMIIASSLRKYQMHKVHASNTPRFGSSLLRYYHTTPFYASHFTHHDLLSLTTTTFALCLVRA